MLSPEPCPRVLRSGADAFSPFPADPRFSRATPDALFARIKEADAGNVVGSSESWSGNILREKARKRPVTSPGRAKLLGSLKQKAVAAECKRRDRQEHSKVMESPAPAKPVTRQDTAVMLPPKRVRYSGNYTRGRRREDIPIILSDRFVYFI